MKRRGFLAGGVSAGAALAGALPLSAGPALAAPAKNAGLVALPAGAAPFDGAGRRDLALDALTYLVRQQGLFPGRWVYQLPAPGWLGGYEPRGASVSWDVSAPGGAPLYLLAHAKEDGDLDAGSVTISVDGAPISGLSSYVERGIAALWGGQMREIAVLGVVFAPPAAGTYKIEARTRGTTGTESVATYHVTVAAPDALSPVLLRDPAGVVHAVAGHQRRRVPDDATRRTLGYGDGDVRGASAELLAALPEGEPLPALREGLVVASSGSSNAFLLRAGTRARVIVEPDGPLTLEVDRVTLQTIRPELADGMLVHGALPDVFHVDRLSLRKIPSWKWLEERGIRASEPVYVPDRIVAALPQNSPHWVQPGGTWMDRTFFSEMLGRFMPYRVYLPAGYDRTTRRYPTLYLLHGQSGRYDEWSGYGVETVANELTEAGKVGQMIMVAPQGGLGYWMNQDGGALGRGTPWGDYMAKDLVRHVDQSFRTVAQREARAVGGLSMGGHGAIQLALNYASVFGVAGAHSPSIRQEGSTPAYFGTGGFFLSRDPVSLVERAELGVKPPKIWIDAGSKDPWRVGAEGLHKALEEKGWGHEWRVFEGEHDGWYWGDHVWEYLPFYSAALAA